MAWFFIALLISGLFALILLLALPSNMEARPQIRNMPPADEKTCPQCAETVKKAAIVCRFCGYQFQTKTPDVATASEEYRGVIFSRNPDLSISAEMDGTARRWQNIMLFRAEVDQRQ